MDVAPVGNGHSCSFQMSGKSRTGHKNRGTKLVLPVGRIARYISNHVKAYNCSSKAHIAATASIQAIIATVIDHAIEQCKDGKRKRINSSHLLKGIRNDETLDQGFKNAAIFSSGTFAAPPPPRAPSSRTTKRKRVKASA